jgi:hypothetical protein
VEEVGMDKQRIASVYMEEEDAALEEYARTRGIDRSEVEEDLQRTRHREISAEMKMAVRKIQDIRAKMGEAEEMNVYAVDPSIVAEELTKIDLRFAREVSPVEMAEFDPKDHELRKKCPNFTKYLEYTEGLSKLPSSPYVKRRLGEKKVLFDMGEVSPREVSAREEKGEGGLQKYFLRVLKKLSKRNNANAHTAIAKGMRGTQLRKADLERVLEDAKEMERVRDMGWRKKTEGEKGVYILDMLLIEEDLHSCFAELESTASGERFKRIIEYFDYLRSAEPGKINKKINHKLISLVNGAESGMAGEAYVRRVDAEGFFIFSSGGMG